MRPCSSARHSAHRGHTLGIDSFDFADALGGQKQFLCSKDLKDFVDQNHLDLSLDGEFNPRDAFGSHDDRAEWM